MVKKKAEAEADTALVVAEKAQQRADEYEQSNQYFRL